MKRAGALAVGLAAALLTACGHEPRETPPPVVPRPAQVTSGQAHALKNVIVMISDGCGYHHIEATDLYETGRTGTAVYERFPAVWPVTTWSQDCQDNGVTYDPSHAWCDFGWLTNATDSAASATAMASGIKTYNGMLGLDAEGNPVTSVLERAEELGKATGVVTTVPFSHATPAGFVAHQPSREAYAEIANEMLFDSACEVIIGACHPDYDEDGKPAAEPEYKYVGGEETWRDVVAGQAGSPRWTLITARQEFQDLADGAAPQRLLGVARVHSTIQEKRTPALDRNGDGTIDLQDAKLAGVGEDPFNPGLPTLPELSLAALNVLDDNANGLFVMIEGGAVDWASHDNQPARLVEEEQDFNRAVEAVVAWVAAHSSWDETLLLVTADHECGFVTAPSGVPADPLVSHGAGHLPGFRFNLGDHTNALIPLFAKGLGSADFAALTTGTDPVKGNYVDDTAVAQVVFDRWR